MITESGLRAVLTDEARDISDPDEIIARVHLAEPRRQPSVRRWLVPAAAAAAVVAAITAVGLVVGDRHNGSGPARSRPRPFPGCSARIFGTPMTVDPGRRLRRHLSRVRSHGGVVLDHAPARGR